MKRPDGHDLIGVGLLACGFGVMALCARLVVTGDASDVAVFLPLLLLVTSMETVVGYELWKGLR